MKYQIQTILPLNTENYSQDNLTKWIKNIIEISEKYPEEKLVSSWFIFTVETLLGKTVNVFIDWSTEKTQSDIIGDIMLIQVIEIIEYDLDTIPNFVLDKINSEKKLAK